MEKLRPEYLIFGLLGTVALIIAIFISYQIDAKKTPEYFNSSKKVFGFIILFVALLVFIKFIHGAIAK